NGPVIFVSEVSDEESLILTSEQGMTMRIPVKDIRIQGRNTMGVRIMRLNKGDKIVSVSKVINGENDPDEKEDEETNTAD
ncbi:MAG: hypothetical protein KKH94_09150, partial [Candidatus Omnitrophica bacterium]|nr:hypothetical protein [Candidatus Omnitrophota bacterium]